MVDHDPSVVNPDETPVLHSWHSNLENLSWYEIMKQNYDEVSTNFIEVTSEFATTLKEFLLNKATAGYTPLQTVNFLNNFKKNMPQAMESLFKISDIEYLDLPQESIVKETEKKEEIAANIFSRVLDIFLSENKNLNELYSKMDINKDGKIKFEEMRSQLLKYDPTITAEETQAVFEILDGNSDGSISLHEFTKRMILIEERAELEKTDPLSVMVISKPLDPSLVHGNLAVMLIKGVGLKPGTHSVKIKIADFLEYLVPETADSNPEWNFRADFFFENKTLKTLPVFIDIEILHKNVIEGTGSFQWKKAIESPNEFSLKTKVVIKTSTGQIRGTLHFQVQWTPISVKVYTEEELQKIKALEQEVLEHKKARQELEKIEKIKKKRNSTDPEADRSYDRLNTEESKIENSESETESQSNLGSGSSDAYSYIMKISKVTVQKVMRKRSIPRALPRPASTTGLPPYRKNSINK